MRLSFSQDRDAMATVETLGNEQKQLCVSCGRTDSRLAGPD